jgi:hypothetical protein
MDFLFGIGLKFRKDGPWLAIVILFILGFAALTGGYETLGYVFVAIALIFGFLPLAKRRRHKGINLPETTQSGRQSLRERTQQAFPCRTPA